MNTFERTTVWVDGVPIGHGSPVVIQSMTNTDTSDVDATAGQILELYDAGARIVRVTVADESAAKAIPHIVERVQKTAEVPLVGDFHFNGNILLKKHPACAQALSKYRINPGNADEKNFRDMVHIALKNQKPIRIGVNAGSVAPHILSRLMEENARREEKLPTEMVLEEGVVESALESLDAAKKLGMPDDRIILSAKLSDVPSVIRVYVKLHEQTNVPLHLGVTESGSGDEGIIASTAALAVLLHQGIGDTIRVSLTPTPGEGRTREVTVAGHILQSLGLMHVRPRVVSCPGCGRTTSDYYQELTCRVNERIDNRMREWKKIYPGVERMKVAVMGCVVNGPGESQAADIGISLPGKMEAPLANVYIDGQHYKNLKGEDIDEQFLTLLERFVADRYGKGEKMEG